MPTLPTAKMATEFPLTLIGPFGVPNIAASQTAAAAKLNANDATTGTSKVVDIPMPYAGSIVGVIYCMDTNVTHVALSVTPTINGTAITTPAQLVAVAATVTARKFSALVDAQQTGARFKALDALGLFYTTSGAFTPSASNDLQAWLVVQFEAVQN